MSLYCHEKRCGVIEMHIPYGWASPWRRSQARLNKLELKVAVLKLVRRAAGVHKQGTSRRLTPERKAAMIAELQRGYAELKGDADALHEEIEEGHHLDEALSDTIVED